MIEIQLLYTRVQSSSPSPTSAQLPRRPTHQLEVYHIVPGRTGEIARLPKSGTVRMSEHSPNLASKPAPVAGTLIENATVVHSQWTGIWKIANQKLRGVDHSGNRRRELPNG
jgi:hypothetical protein